MPLPHIKMATPTMNIIKLYWMWDGSI